MEMHGAVHQSLLANETAKTSLVLGWLFVFHVKLGLPWYLLIAMTLASNFVVYLLGVHWFHRAAGTPSLKC